MFRMTFPPRFQRPRLILDRVEKIAVVALFAWLCLRFAGDLKEEPANLIFLVSEGAVALMVLLRRATDQISLNPVDWIIGVGGTLLPMLVSPADGGWSGGVGLLAAGLMISLVAKLTLGRSFGVVAANRGVKRSGVYGAVRHPMYLGYFLTYAGVLLLNPSLWNSVLLLTWAALQIARIEAEERILMLDPAYQDHAGRVRFRLVPFVY
jgi:protein-S-isoprenylcysteine O-methyltransferase Ste14